MNELNTFLVEIQNRPDGQSNKTISSYSSEAMTVSMFYQRAAQAVVSTQFVSVFLMVLNQNGGVIEQRFITTQYQPPEPEPEGEGGEEEPEG